MHVSVSGMATRCGHPLLTRSLASFGPPAAGLCWFVCYSLRRPLPAWHLLRPKLLRVLTHFRDDPRENKRTSIRVDDSIELDFLRASEPHPMLFVPGAHSDDDSGGFVLAELQKNLTI